MQPETGAALKHLIQTVLDQLELIPAGTKMHMGVDGK
jgi:hypothetical protein